MMRFLLVLLAGCALVGAGAAGALLGTPDKLTIVLGGAETAREAPPPPPADRTDEVLGGLGSLRTALVEFARALDAAGAERDSIRDDQRARSDELARRLDGIERRLETALARAEAPAPAAPTLPQPVAAPEPAPPPEPEPAAAPAPKPRPSLAALLREAPREDVRERLARWRLVPGHCRVGFDGTSTIHNFTARSDDAAGHLLLHLRDPADQPSGVLTMEVASLDSGVEGRDEEIHRHLSADGHPAVRCEVLALEPQRTENGVTHVAARLRFTIHGESREVDGRATLEFTPQRLLHVRGETVLKMSDFAIHPKAKLGLIKVDDEVTAWWDLYAEPDPAAR